MPYGVSKHKPYFGVGTYSGFGEVFDVNKNQWYQSPSVFSDTMDTLGTWSIGSGAALTLDSGRLKGTRTDTSSQFLSFRKTLTLVQGKRYIIQVKFDSGTLDRAIIQMYDATYTNGLKSGNWTYNSGYVTIDYTSTGTDYLSIGIGQDSTIGRYAWIDTLVIYPINNDGSVDITSATPITESRNYLNAIVYADAGGQPTFVEQLPKIEYKDILKANEYQGKNACTAWVNFDGTTTPPTIRDSFNVSAVIRTGTGLFDVYFKVPMDNTNYVQVSGGNDWFVRGYLNAVNKCSVATFNSTPAIANLGLNMVNIFGGRN